MKLIHANHHEESQEVFNQPDTISPFLRLSHSVSKKLGRILGKLAVLAMFGYLAAFWCGIAALVYGLFRLVKG